MEGHHHVLSPDGSYCLMCDAPLSVSLQDPKPKVAIGIPVIPQAQDSRVYLSNILSVVYQPFKSKD